MVTYDVVEKRTEKFRRLLCRYLVHEQNSVFSGVLKKSEMDAMREELSIACIPGDRFLVVIASNRHNIKVERLEAGKRGVLKKQDTFDSSSSSAVL